MVPVKSEYGNRNPYPYTPTAPFPYGKDREYSKRNVEQSYGLGLGRVRNNIHSGGAEAVEAMRRDVEPDPNVHAKVMRGMLKGAAPDWQWDRSGSGSFYRGSENKVHINPDEYKRYGLAVPLHEAMHAMQSTREDGRSVEMQLNRFGEDNYRVGRELAPSIGSVVGQAQAILPAIGDEMTWQMGETYSPSIEYLRQQAERHGVFDGKSIERLIAENPQFMQTLARQDSQHHAGNGNIGVLDNSTSVPDRPVLANNTANLQTPDIASLDMTQMPGANRTNTRAVPASVSPYGLSPKSFAPPQSPMPQPTYSQPAAPPVVRPVQPPVPAPRVAPPQRQPMPTQAPQQPQIQSRIDAQNQMAQKWGEMGPSYFEQQGAQRRAELEQKYPQYADKRPQAPWEGNRAYDNVDPNARRGIANRTDPTSWANMTRTDGEVKQQIGNRTDAHLAGLRERNYDPNNSRGGYQYSPVNPGIVGLNTQEQQAAQQSRADQVARYRQFGMERDQRIVNDPTAQARYKAMNGGKDGPVDPAQYRSQIGSATVAYNHYARSAREAGQNPISFDTFLPLYGTNNLSPELQGHIQQGRELRRQSLDAQDRNKRGPSLQFAQYMNQRYGMPMALPSDPQQAAQWQNSLAMQGNPYAAQSNLVNQQQMAAMGLAGMNNAAMLQNTNLQQAGLNYREGIKQQAPLDPTQRAQIMTQWGINDPQIRREQAERKHMADMQAQWASGTQADRERIQNEARQKGNEAARIAESTRGMLSQNFPTVVGGYGLPAPQAPGAMPPSGSPTTTSVPGTLTADPSGGAGAPGYGLPGASTAQPQGSPAPSNPGGMDPGKYISTPAPTNATSDDMFNAYSSLRNFYGREPTMDEVKKHLQEQGKAIPQHPENSGEITPYYNYSRNPAQEQQGSPFGTSYRTWLDKYKQELGVAPEDPSSQYAPGNYSGF